MNLIRKYLLLSLLVVGFAANVVSLSARPLRVVTTTTELASLVQLIGGEGVSVASIARPGEGPHFIDARPSYIKLLQDADVFVQNGLDLEVGWAPVLLQSSRNARILNGQPAFIDVSLVIRPLFEARGEASRALGDIHPNGNPHFMVDPAAGLVVAAFLKKRLLQLQPAASKELTGNYTAFVRRLGKKLLGTGDAGQTEKLAALLHAGGYPAYASYLQKAGQLPGGWMQKFSRWQGRGVIVEHAFWNYFAKTSGLAIVAALEPVPGVSPTSKQLSHVVERMKREKIKIILNVPYFPKKYADLVAHQTGARVLLMANAVDARKGTGDLIQLYEYNFQQLQAMEQ